MDYSVTTPISSRFMYTGAAIQEGQIESPDASTAGDFGERLVEGFFRSWYLYITPIVLFAALGLYSASGMVGQYTSIGRLNATANPYVDQPTIRGTEISYYETPASGTARLINEQLGSDSFVDDVAERAGLSEYVETGLITRGSIRASLGAYAAGNNNLTVGASWADPETALELANATLAGYTDYLANIAAADSAEAVDFWTERKAAATEDVLAAQAQLSDYMQSLPQGAEAERTTGQTLEIDRLQSTIDRALDVESKAQASIDEAAFTSAQAQGDASRSLLIVDAPTLAAAPSAVAKDQMTTVVMFTMLGVLIAAGALVLRTTLDRTVRTAGQVGHAASTTTIAVVPQLKGHAKKRSGRKSSKSSSKKPTKKPTKKPARQPSPAGASA